jgi:hypothetical protein
MPSSRTYATAGAFRRALEEPLKRIRDALRLTFERRGTHDLPVGLVPPSTDWQIPFHALAEECGLPTDVATVFSEVQEYMEEVLGRRTER